MVDGFRRHGSDQTDLDDDRSYVRKQLANLDLVFAELVEFVLWREATEFFALKLRNLFARSKRFWHGLAIHGGKPGFVIERLQMRWPSGHAQPDDAFGFGWIVQRTD